MKLRKGEDTNKNMNDLPHPLYPSINPAETGAYLKELTVQSGYSVKDIQNLLHLSCPQPVYRWFKGQMLPSVDHLYVLSRLFGVPMEELLFPEGVPYVFNIRRKAACKNTGWKVMEWIDTEGEGMGWRCIKRKNAGKKYPVWRIGESRRLVIYFLASRKRSSGQPSF